MSKNSEGAPAEASWQLNAAIEGRVVARWRWKLRFVAPDGSSHTGRNTQTKIAVVASPKKILWALATRGVV